MTFARQNLIIPASGAVLLVDDESVIRDIGGEMLDALGVKYFTADSGESALALFKQNPEQFILVILDIELPGISGKEVYEKLKQIKPGVKVLFASGYGKEYVENRFFKHIQLHHFLPKPFQLEQLAEKIRLLLLENDMEES